MSVKRQIYRVDFKNKRPNYMPRNSNYNNIGIMDRKWYTMQKLREVGVAILTDKVDFRAKKNPKVDSI